MTTEPYNIKKNRYERACSLLWQLQSTLEEEKELIEQHDDVQDDFNEDKLREKITAVEDLLTGLKKNMPQIVELTPEQSRHLHRLLKIVRVGRDENGRYLAAILEEKGNQILRLSRGRKTLHSYRPPCPLKQELFLKKNC